MLDTHVVFLSGVLSFAGSRGGMLTRSTWRCMMWVVVFVGLEWEKGQHGQAGNTELYRKTIRSMGVVQQMNHKPWHDKGAKIHGSWTRLRSCCRSQQQAVGF